MEKQTGDFRCRYCMENLLGPLNKHQQHLALSPPGSPAHPESIFLERAWYIKYGFSSVYGKRSFLSGTDSAGCSQRYKQEGLGQCPDRPQPRTLGQPSPLLTEGGQAQHGHQQRVIPAAAVIAGIAPIGQDVPVGRVV